jgi:hypothetical protein
MMGLLSQDFLGRVLGAWGGNIGGASKYGTERISPAASGGEGSAVSAPGRWGGSGGSVAGKAIVKLFPHFLHRIRADFHSLNEDGSIR